MLLPENFTVQPFDDSSGLLEDPEALCDRAAEDGFLFFKELLPIPLVDPVRLLARTAFEDHGWVQPDKGNPPFMDAVPGSALEGRGWDDPRWLDFQYRFSNDQGFLALARDRTIVDILEVLLDEPAWRAAMNFCWLKLPGSPEQTTLPHQDRWYLPDCPRMWTVWVPLVDTPFEVGPLGCVPGSHHRGLWGHAGQFTGIEVPPDVRWASSGVYAGDAVFFDALTVHCAWSNVSASRARVSADIRYEPRSVGASSILRPPAPRVYFRDSRGIIDRAPDGGQ